MLKGYNPNFTFQYVSINTNSARAVSASFLVFTFQYVSINTKSVTGSVLL